MKNELLNALKNADTKLSASGQVKIDSDVMSHIGGGASSGAICSMSGECNSNGSSCRTVKGLVTLFFDYMMFDDPMNQPLY